MVPNTNCYVLFFGIDNLTQDISWTPGIFVFFPAFRRPTEISLQDQPLVESSKAINNIGPSEPQMRFFVESTKLPSLERPTCFLDPSPSWNPLESIEILGYFQAPAGAVVPGAPSFLGAVGLECVVGPWNDPEDAPRFEVRLEDAATKLGLKPHAGIFLKSFLQIGGKQSTTGRCTSFELKPTVYCLHELIIIWVCVKTISRGPLKLNGFMDNYQPFVLPQRYPIFDRFLKSVKMRDTQYLEVDHHIQQHIGAPSQNLKQTLILLVFFARTSIKSYKSLPWNGWLNTPLTLLVTLRSPIDNNSINTHLL